MSTIQVDKVADIEELLKDKNWDIYRKRLSAWGKTRKWITMTIQKSKDSSTTITLAIIGLTVSIIIQTGVVVWWARGVSKDEEQHQKDIEQLQKDTKSMLDTQKVYIDTTREKFIKMEAIVEGMRNEKQLEDLLVKERQKERKE